jgi:hypothetical protein
MRWYSMKETISDDVPLPCLIHLWWSQETVHTQLSAPPSVVTSNLAPAAKCGSRGDTGGNGGNFPSYNQLYINSRFQYVRINLGYSIVLNRHQPTSVCLLDAIIFVVSNGRNRGTLDCHAQWHPSGIPGTPVCLSASGWFFQDDSEPHGSKMKQVVR